MIFLFGSGLLLGHRVYTGWPLPNGQKSY